MESSPVWQLNLHHCKLASNNLMLEASKTKIKPILLLQEPYLFKEKPTLKIPNYSVHFGNKKARSLVAVPQHMKAFFIKEISDRDVVAVLLEEEACNAGPKGRSPQKYLLVSAYLDILDTKVISQSLEKCVNFSKQNNIPTILGMDSNAHSTLWGCETNNNRGDILEEFILEHSLVIKNVGCASTFITRRAESIIDITLVSEGFANKVVEWQVNREYQFSDHRRLEFNLEFQSRKTILTRNFKNANWALFRIHLGKNKWVPPCKWSKLDLDKEVEQYTAQIQKSLDVACPMKEIDVNSAKKLWWNNTLQRLKHKTKKLYKKYFRTKSDLSFENFHKARKAYYDAMKQTKREAFQDFSTSIQDVKSLSKASKALNNEANNGIGLIKKNDGTLTISGHEVLNILMDTHFPESYQHEETKTERGAEISNNFICNASFLSYISYEKVKSAIKSFNGFKAAGPDGLKAIVLQKLPDFFLRRLTILFKAATALKYNPKEWCKSRVIFIPKRGKESYDTPKSFRPISLTQVIFKTFEKVQKMEIEDNYLKKSPMHKHQFAFRKGKSTDGALSQVVDKIESGLLRGAFTLAAFLDISGAFDNVLVDSIIRGFRTKGIPEHITHWYESSLRNRVAETSFGDIVIKRSLTKGTAQGGVISTIAWNLAIDELLHEINKPPFLVVGFADDLAVLLTGIDPNTMVALMQPIINKITSTGKKHGLTFNEDKTEVVLFTNKRTKEYSKLKVNKVPVEYSSGAKYLGVWLDSKLNFRKHIEDKVNKCKRHLFALKSLIGSKWGPAPRLMKWAYSGIVRPKLTYACHIWQHRINETIKTKLQRLNRLACLNIAKVHKSTPTKGLEVIYHLPPLDIHIHRVSLNNYLRIKRQVMLSWDGLGNSQKGHLTILENESTKIGTTNIPTDSIIPTRVWNRNYKFLDFQNDASCFEENMGSSIYCYTDGSKIEGSKTGCGYTIRQNMVTITSSSEGLGKAPSVFQAEVLAILRASKAMEKRLRQRIIIRCDSQAAILALKANVIKSALVLECFKELSALGAKNKVTLQWIKAHVGYHGNEEADMLAKKGAEEVLEGPEPFLPVPDTYIKKITKDKVFSTWNSQWKRTKSCRQTKLWMPMINIKVAKFLKNVSRFDLGKLVQFITGHCNLMRHKSLISQSEPTCRLCKVKDKEETPWHLATECPSLILHRTNIFYGRILYSVEWSPGQLLRFCKESKIWGLLDHQQ